jgi:hypothetical protein
MFYLIILLALFNCSLFSQTILSKNWYLFDRENSPLPSNRITSLLYDWNNNIYWIGCGWEFSGNDTIKGGLVRFDGENWTVYNSTNSPLTNDLAEYLAIDANNRLLIANWGEGFYIFDGANWQIFNSNNSPMPSNELQCISVDMNNNIWIGINGYGAMKYDGFNWTLFDHNNAFNGIWDLNFIRADSSGIIWFGSEYDGLYSYDGINWTKEGVGIFADSISLSSFALDRNLNALFAGNILYVASGFLAQFDGLNWSYFDSSSIGYSTRFSYNTLTVDSNNHKFIGSAIGLLKFDDNIWTLFSSYNSPIPYNIFTVGTTDKHNNKIYGLRANRPPHPTGYAGLIFFNEDSVVVTSVNDNIFEINSYKLYQNYPNPFNPHTVISFQIPVAGKVTIKLFDILGREIETIIDEERTAGIHSINFNGNYLASGIYFYSISVNDFHQSKKMVLLR